MPISISDWKKLNWLFSAFIYLTNSSTAQEIWIGLVILGTFFYLLEKHLA